MSAIPVAAVTAAAAVYVPVLAALAAFAVWLLVVVTFFVKVALDWGGLPESDRTSVSDGVSGGYLGF